MSAFDRFFWLLGVITWSVIAGILVYAAVHFAGWLVVRAWRRGW